MHHHHHGTGYADRYKTQQNAGASYQGGNTRQPYHKPHTSLGAAGHWIHLLNIAAPLVIGEMVKDADKKWRYLRLASVGGAVISEAAWTMKVAHDRRKEEEARAQLDDCRQEHCR